MSKNKRSRQNNLPPLVGNAGEAAKDDLRDALALATAVAESACEAYPDNDSIQVVCGELLRAQLQQASNAASRLP